MVDSDLSPEGKQLAIGGSLGVWIFDFQKGSFIAHKPLPVSTLSTLSWSPDGSKIAVGTHEGAMYLLDATQDKILHTNRAAAGISEIAWSPDSQWIALRSSLTNSGEPAEEAVFLWNPDTNILSVLVSAGDFPGPNQNGINGLSWDPAGTRIAAASAGNYVIIHSLDPQESPQSFQTFSENSADNLFIQDLSWSPTGAILALSWSVRSPSSEEKDPLPEYRLSFWDLENNQEIAAIQGLSNPAIDWSAAGSLAATNQDGIQFFNERGKLMQPLAVPGIISDLSWDPSGSKLLIKQDGANVHLWNDAVESLTDLDFSSFYHRGITQVGWSFQGAFFAALGDNRLSLYAKDSFADPFHSQEDMSAFAWSPTGNTLAVITRANDFSMMLVSEDGLTPILTTELPQEVLNLTWSPDGKQLALHFEEYQLPNKQGELLDAGILLWDPLSRTVLQKLDTRDIAAAPDRPFVFGKPSWAPDRDVIAAGTSQGEIYLWDRVDGKLLQKSSGHQDAVPAVDWSPSSSMFVSGSWDQTVKIWNADSGAVEVSYSDLPGQVNAVDWGLQGLIAAASDRSIMIWDYPSPDLYVQLPDQPGVVADLAWSPTEVLLASATNTGVLSIWSFPR